MQGLFCFSFAIIFLLAFATFFCNFAQDVQAREPLIKGPADSAKFFPTTPNEIELAFQSAKDDAIAQVEQILAIPSKDRTFENTVLALDTAEAYFGIYGSKLAVISKLHPDDAMRTKADEMLQCCVDIGLDLFQANKKMYQALKEFKATNKELLNQERDEYFSDLMAGLKIAGLELDDEKFKKMQELQKKIAALSIQFHTNIVQDKSKISFTKDELIGIDDDFLNSQAKNDEGYVLNCDYPTTVQVLNNCSVHSTRKKYAYVYRSRAFPENIDVLNQLINTRDELAHLLGYNSYAELDVVFTMAQRVDTIEKFLADVTLNSSDRVKKAWGILKNDLPESVKLTSEGKLESCDVQYLLNHYLKNHLNVDQEKIAEYFPMERTVRGLLDIYEQFFTIKFQVIEGNNFWHPSVQLIEVQNSKDNTVFGYVLIDLFARENKYTNPCCFGVLPSMSFDKGQTFAPALAVVNGNFTKSTETKPALLKHDEVRVFFHEFGHAIHVLFGKAEMPTKAGYNTKFDFVETPSQLLEEWIWDPEILKRLGCHYQTGESLSDATIEQLIKTRKIKEAISLDAQLSYAMISLSLYKEGQNKNLHQIKKDLYDRGLQIIAYDDAVNALCSFVHLSGYGPKYYTYLWSEQMAKQIFDYIKLNGGLLDPVMGKRYISKILSRGGSCDPKQMIADFLGTNAQAVK